MNAYSYTSKNFTGFEWDTELLINQLSEVRYLQGRLVGRMESLKPELRNEAIIDTLTLEVLKSTEIEGELLNEADVKILISKKTNSEKLLNSKTNSYLKGIVFILTDATKNYKLPLTYERLNKWNLAISQDKINSDAVEITPFSPSNVENSYQELTSSNPYNTEDFTSEPTTEMDRFLNWYNSDDKTDPILKAGIAHFWYLSITRFKKGNGRIARALTDMWLSRSDNSSQRFYSMSAQIRKERIGYYDIVVKSLNGKPDITSWLEWFLHCLLNSLKSTDSILSRILFKSDFWNKHSKTSFNDRQILMLDKLFDEFQGKLTSSKWAAITNCSSDSALRDIQDLINKEILVKEKEGGRSTNYELNY